MRRASYRSLSRPLRRSAGVGLVLAAILIGGVDVTCDSDAGATFRQEATSAIGDGVKTILDGIVDGVVAAIGQAGDGTSTSDTASTDTSQ